MHYYQHHIGDFIRDTSRLTDSQCMAYLRMLWMYYESEQPIPINARSIAFKLGAEQEVVELILEAYFKLDGDVWRHTRCDKEIAEYQAICERNKTNGKAGGRPKKTQSVSIGEQPGAESEPSRNPNQYPVTNNQEPKEEPTPLPPNPEIPAKRLDGYSPEFEEFWGSYPTRPGASKAQSWKAWQARIKAGTLADEMIRGAGRYAAYVLANRTEPNYVKQPATFLGPDLHFRSDWSIQPRASPDRYMRAETQAEKRTRCAQEMFSTIRQEAHDDRIIDIN